jgi:hypothetical protein
MTSFKGRRGRFGVLLAAALGALSIFVLPGLASARGGGDDSSATIKSFDQTTKTLVVDLPDGQTVSGVVTRRTRIRCEDQSGQQRGGHGVRGREAEPGDDHGGHGEEAGDDDGGRGEEPGDDNGGHGEEPGDDSGGNSTGPGGPSNSGPSGHDDNGSGVSCSTADLIPGAAVEEIELEFRSDTVVFDEVELNS